MTAATRPVDGGGRPRSADARRADRTGALVEFWLRAQTLLLYLFLYFPIVVVVVFSFNGTNQRVTDWQGFSLRWYASVLGDTVIQSALQNSLIVASFTSVIATVFGTMAALGLQRAPRWFRAPFTALTYVSIIVPEIVIALATLVFFSRPSTSSTRSSGSSSSSASRRSSWPRPCSTSAWSSCSSRPA